MTQLRSGQLTKLGTVLDALFPEYAPCFASLGSPSALARARALAHARGARAAAALRGHARAPRRQPRAPRRGQGARAPRGAQTSVGLADPYGATSIAVQTLVAHLEHLRAQIATLGERLDALQADDAPVRTLLASIPGFGRETVRTWCAELPAMQAYAEQARAQSHALPPGTKPKHGADKLVAAVGLDAQVKQSGRWQGQVRMSKRGNRYVRRAIMLAAQTASRTDPQCQAIYAAQRAKGKHHTVAVSHVAHQLLHIAYSVLLHALPYTVPARFTTTAAAPQLAEAGA
jgi:transposase